MGSRRTLGADSNHYPPGASAAPAQTQMAAAAFRKAVIPCYRATAEYPTHMAHPTTDWPGEWGGVTRA